MDSLANNRSDTTAGQVGGASLLTRIGAMKGELRKSESAVADFVLAQPSEVLNFSIAELAYRVGVSQPTVARFANALGFSGFKEFKLRLAQSMAGGMPFVHRDVGPEDSLNQAVLKVFDRSIGALLNVRNHLDPARVARAVDILAEARRIEFYGIGNSGIVAQDAQHKGTSNNPRFSANSHHVTMIAIESGSVSSVNHHRHRRFRPAFASNRPGL